MSRPPSRKPIHRSGAGGIRSAAIRSFDAIDRIDRAVAATATNMVNVGLPPLERPDRKPRDHRRVGEPVEQIAAGLRCRQPGSDREKEDRTHFSRETNALLVG